MRFSLALILLSLAGCADDNVSVFIRNNIAPEQDDDGCTFSPASNESIEFGRWDVGTTARTAGFYPNGYALSVAAINQIQRRATTVASEPNGVQITSAEIEILNLAGDTIGFNPPPGSTTPLPNPFRVPASGYIAPADGIEAPGETAIGFTAIPLEYREQLVNTFAPPRTNTIILSVRLRGRTLGQIDILTDAWEYPVELCDGCLVACSGTPMDQAFACRPGQDAISLDFCACADADPTFCP
ncbi:MAG: hypothetical protein AAF411_27540 [Myxococcota bacterium]